MTLIKEVCMKQYSHIIFSLCGAACTINPPDRPHFFFSQCLRIRAKKSELSKRTYLSTIEGCLPRFPYLRLKVDPKFFIWASSVRGDIILALNVAQSQNSLAFSLGNYDFVACWDWFQYHGCESTLNYHLEYHRPTTGFSTLSSQNYIHAGHVTWDEYRVKFLASKGFNEKEVAEKIKNNEELKVDEESK